MKHVLFCCSSSADVHSHLDDVIIELQRAMSYVSNPEIAFVYSPDYHAHAIAVYESGYSVHEIESYYQSFLSFFEKQYKYA
jgi:hypothetical protein